MNRHQRRALAKTSPQPRASLSNLEDVALGLQGLLESGQQVQELASQLEDVLQKVNEARDIFEVVLRETETSKYEQERQRWVTLRLVGTVNPLEVTNVQALFRLEEQYRAEYDVLQALPLLKKSQ